MTVDIYIVLDGSRVVGASAKLQGAELIRAESARRRARVGDPQFAVERERALYDLMQVVNTELRDLED